MGLIATRASILAAMTELGDLTEARKPLCCHSRWRETVVFLHAAWLSFLPLLLSPYKDTRSLCVSTMIPGASVFPNTYCPFSFHNVSSWSNDQHSWNLFLPPNKLSLPTASPLPNHVPMDTLLPPHHYSTDVCPSYVHFCPTGLPSIYLLWIPLVFAWQACATLPITTSMVSENAHLLWRNTWILGLTRYVLWLTN